VSTGRIYLVKPTQKWLCRSYYNRGSINRVYVNASRISSCGTKMKLQHPTQTLTTFDGPVFVRVARFQKDQPVSQTPMVALSEIVRCELPKRRALGVLSE
jgi:hypothetical protein